MTAATIVIGEEATDETSPALLHAAIREAKAGSERAFEEIMIATERRVAMLAWRITGDAEETKEAVQETFLRLYRHLGRYDETRDFSGWLFRIAVNVCRDLEKRRRRRRIFAPIDDAHELPSRDPAADEILARRDEVGLLRRAIDALPPKEKLAIVLRDVEERSTDEVAALLGSSPATVRVQVMKARAKIKQWIERWRR